VRGMRRTGAATPARPLPQPGPMTVDSRTYLVHMPRAEACHLAGIGPPGLPGPKDSALAAVREWMADLACRRLATVPVARVVGDLTAILDLVPAAAGPVRGPFAPPADSRSPLPGTVAYLGSGTVRLDEDAIGALAGLAPGQDFRVAFTDAGPVLSVGADTYLARAEGPDCPS
jgi:hypothetical protein